MIVTKLAFTNLLNASFECKIDILILLFDPPH